MEGRKDGGREGGREDVRGGGGQVCPSIPRETYWSLPHRLAIVSGIPGSAGSQGTCLPDTTGCFSTLCQKPGPPTVYSKYPDARGGGGNSSAVDANYPPPPPSSWRPQPRSSPPPTNCWPEAPGGGGLGGVLGGAMGGVGLNGPFFGGGVPGGSVGGLGGIQVGRFGGGGHAPKAKRWSITGSPYLPLPSL